MARTSTPQARKPAVDPATPAWVLDVADDALRAAEQALIDRMLSDAVSEDITDTPLWRHRRSQLMSLLAAKAAAR